MYNFQCEETESRSRFRPTSGKRRLGCFRQKRYVHILFIFIKPLLCPLGMRYLFQKNPPDAQCILKHILIIQIFLSI